MKIVIPNLKPRNPLVVMTKFRRSGAHSTGNRRQQEQRSVQRDLHKTMRGD